MIDITIERPIEPKFIEKPFVPCSELFPDWPEAENKSLKRRNNDSKN